MLRRGVGEHAGVVDGWREFDVEVARWRLGEVMVEQLPAAAAQALVDGCASESLGHLAAMEGAGWSEIEPVLARVLDERGLHLPSEDEAMKCVADDGLGQLATGELLFPEETADRLRHLSMKGVNRPAWEDLAVFHHLSLDWEVADDAGLDRDNLRREMVREARELEA